MEADRSSSRVGATVQQGVLGAPWSGTYSPRGEKNFRDISEAIPEFGGYFLNEAGELVVSVTDLNVASEARQAVSPIARRLALTPGGKRTVVVREANHSFIELHRWRSHIADNWLDQKDVTFLDLNEARNVITVGLSDLEKRSRYISSAREAHIPEAALEFRETGRFVPNNRSSVRRNLVTDTTLGARFDSVPAGVLVKMVDENDNVYDRCTMGFTARRPSGDTIFITSSHCSLDFATLDNARVWQGSSGASNDEIGQEVADPELNTAINCDLCRMSDVSFFAWTNPDPDRKTMGVVARTEHSNGSRVIDDPPNNRFTVGEEGTVPVQHELVNMIGKRSGWVDGDVTHTCADVPQWEEGYRLACQYFASYPGDQGDSGGPVFRLQGGEFELLGAHVGEETSGKKRGFFFSDIVGIEEDFGENLVVLGFRFQ